VESHPFALFSSLFGTLLSSDGDEGGAKARLDLKAPTEEEDHKDKVMKARTGEKNFMVIDPTFLRSGTKRAVPVDTICHILLIHPLRDEGDSYAGSEAVETALALTFGVLQRNMVETGKK
jgi:hypothetical protein